MKNKNYIANLQNIHNEIKRALILLNRLNDEVIELKIAMENEGKVPTKVPDDRWEALERNFK